MNAAQFNSEFDFLQLSPAVAQALKKAERFEAAVYRADAYFQAEIVPVVAIAIHHMAIVAIELFIRAAIASYVSGVRAACWYAAYNEASVPTMAEVLPLCLPAETVFHPGRAVAENRAVRQLCKTLMVHAVEALPGVEVLITPAPKGRRLAGIAPRKAPTQAKVGTRTACID